MTDEQLFLFDLCGYLVIEDAVTDRALRALNAALDEMLRARGSKNSTSVEFKGVIYDHKAFRELIDNTNVRGHLAVLLGEKFRLDHDYALVLRNGYTGAGLHGGSTPFDPAQYYTFRDGRPRSGLTVVAYNLETVSRDEGGFACIPGSHKSNVDVPKRWSDPRTWRKADCPIETVPVRAGSAVLFTEALAHGTMPWRGEKVRRTVFFKYCPASLAFAVPHYNVDEFNDLTDSQALLLEGPNARYPDRRQLQEWVKSGKPVRQFAPKKD